MEVYKRQFKETMSIDLNYIYNRLLKYWRNSITEDDLIEGILIDLNKRHDRKVKINLEDHIRNSIDEIRNKKDVLILTKEIYRLFK